MSGEPNYGKKEATHAKITNWINRTLQYIDTLPDTPEYRKIRELLTSDVKNKD